MRLVDLEKVGSMVLREEGLGWEEAYEASLPAEPAVVGLRTSWVASCARRVSTSCEKVAARCDSEDDVPRVMLGCRAIAVFTKAAAACCGTCLYVDVFEVDLNLF